jgi:hypothetical protein
MAKVDKKYLTMKPEVSKIFDDLEAYHDYCRFNMLRFDEKDLYKGSMWRRSVGQDRGGENRGYNGRKPRHNNA